MTLLAQTNQLTGSVSKSISGYVGPDCVDSRSRILVVCVLLLDFALLWVNNTQFWFMLGHPFSLFLAAHAAALALLSMMYFVVPKTMKNTNAPLLAAIVAFGAIAVSTTLWHRGIHLTGAIRAASIAVSMLSLVYVCPRVLRKQDYCIIFASILSALSLHAIFALWLCASHTHVLLARCLDCNVGRVHQWFGTSASLTTGLCTNPNYLGLLLLYELPLALWIENYVRSRYAKVAARCAFIITAAHLVVTLSRAAVITSVMSFALNWCNLPGTHNRKAVVISTTAMLLCALFVAGQLANGSYDTSLLDRWQLWLQCLNAIVKNPWGYGVLSGITEQRTHSFIIATLLNFGVAGLLSLITVIWLVLAPAYQRIKSHARLRLLWITAILVVIFHGSMEYYIGRPAQCSDFMFWLLLGFLSIKTEDSRDCAS